MSAADDVPTTTVAIEAKVSFLVALSSAWDHLLSDAGATIAAVRADHASSAPSDLLSKVDDLLARLEDVEALASGALVEIEASLARADGHGFR